jgi:hypothetical protein
MTLFFASSPLARLTFEDVASPVFRFGGARVAAAPDAGMGAECLEPVDDVPAAPKLAVPKLRAAAMFA